ncbi:N-acetylmuramoyl-L-alanine amidase [Planctomycetota bacterium]
MQVRILGAGRSSLRGRRSYCGWTLIGLLGGMWLTGCQTVHQRPSVYQGSSGSVSYEPVAQALSVAELARQLHLSVVEENETYIKLKNAQNTVLIFSYSDAQFFVNGKAAGRVGKTKEVAGVLHVDSTLVSRIRSRLETSRPPSKALTREYGLGTRRGMIVIDAGHGGKDPGATSVLGFKEKDINLSVAKQLADSLKAQGFHTILTRDTDRFIELEQRAAIANWQEADLFISVHADSCATPSVTGCTLYVARGASGKSRQVAQSVERAMISAGSQSRGVREADYRVLVKTRCPAILVELGYLSNYWESRRLKQVAMQQRLAQAIASGAAKGGSWASSGEHSTVAVSGQRSSRTFAYPAQ